ncbi:OB-fold nucleic acid binding domain-containing protein [Demequina activiva]|uniref:OB domain-containing protein n=1 Tax=Demequina activiva TaxID=1582364 RepID=A0A919Q1V8_9MICO|nr:OB-fold nucleic acid binding domain-containing protein [Demequina activiva]GIG54682.1 hypothetical protein Dac01nite_14340 [Demequina activiva]
MSAVATPIRELNAREMATVEGRVVAITVEPHDAAPRLTARIDDGTGRIDAVFMGRRSIAGIEPGARVSVAGRVCEADAALRLFNPRFEIR